MMQSQIYTVSKYYDVGDGKDLKEIKTEKAI